MLKRHAHWTFPAKSKHKINKCPKSIIANTQTKRLRNEQSK